VQLPAETGELFRQNAVTGYDFAELVEDDGAALVQELGIHRAAYQKKLVRSMRMLMSGVGVAPDRPQVIFYSFFAVRVPSARLLLILFCQGCLSPALFTSDLISDIVLLQCWYVLPFRCRWQNHPLTVGL